MARKITVDGIEYAYVVGRQNVRITSPDGKSRAVDFSTLTGMDWNTIEKGIWKRWFKITPRDIERVIKLGT